MGGLLDRRQSRGGQVSRDQLARIPRLLDVGKKQEPQGELCLEDPKKNPRKWNPRVAKLAGMVLEKLKGTK
jgi:hypothetical protein